MEIDAKALARELEPYVKETRRYLHMHPEHGLEEYETAAFIRSELDKEGIPWITAGETGTIGIITGDPGSDNILAMRADIDALILDEMADCEFRSQNPGLMHGCGHDAHTAMLLGAAKILKGLEGQFPGKLWLLFQPGEETAMGAKSVIASGALSGVKAMYGQHVWAQMETGKVSTRRGPLMSGARIINITVKGKGGHGSSLDKTIDPVLASSAIVVALQSVVSHNVSPFESATVCVGAIHSGTLPNIIPETGTLSLTTRFFTKEMDERLCRRIEETAEFTAKSYGCTAEVTYGGWISALGNDPELTELLEGSIVKTVGKENLAEEPMNLGSEDFAEFADLCPVTYAFIGSGNPEKGSTESHHSPYFKIDEDCLATGTALYVQFALDYFEI